MGVTILKKQEVDVDVLTLARERIATTFDRFDIVSVGFSGGKDSTVCLNLAYAEAQKRGVELDVVFWDEECIPPETIEYIDRVSRWPGLRLRWFCLPVQEPNGCSRSSPWWYPWAPEDREKWVRPLPAQAITELPGFVRAPIAVQNGAVYPNKSKTVGLILGLRTQESLRRYYSVARRRVDNWISVDPEANATHISIAKPIYDWRSEDIWTAIHMFGWDYSRSYDVMTRAGTNWLQQRIASPFGREPSQRLHAFATHWPELWEKMCRRVPGAATAARYANSPLYGVNGTPPVKDDEPDWKEAIQHELFKWPEDVRKTLALRIHRAIQHHNRVTGHRRIPNRAGNQRLSWQALHKLVARGDLKKRQTLNHWEGHIEELDALLEAEERAAQARTAGETEAPPAED